MRVMGVDPGLTRCGIGVVDSENFGPARLVKFGVVVSAATMPLHERLAVVADGIDQWMDAIDPQVLAVERVFAQHNVSTVMGTAQVAGLAMVAAFRRGVEVAMHTPSEVKAAVTGSGRADKQQVQVMVAKILHLTDVPKPADAADALALALCCLWRPSGAVGQTRSDGLTEAQRVWAGRKADPVGRTGLNAAQQAWNNAQINASRSTDLTPAQRAWAEAERQSARQR